MQCYARMLERGDAIDIVGLARAQHASSRYAHIPYDGERVYQFCGAVHDLPNYGCAVLVNEDARVVGYAGVVIEPYMWADIKLARDLAVYVDPAHRSMPHLRRLMQEVEEWCRVQGVHTLDMGITSPPDDDMAKRYGKVYLHLGYSWHGEHYRKELSNG